MSSARVATFQHRWEANTARSYLAEHGIEAEVLADDGGELGPALSFDQVAVIVPAEDEQDARRLLDAHEPDGPSEPSAPGMSRGERAVLVVGLLVLAGVIALFFLTA